MPCDLMPLYALAQPLIVLVLFPLFFSLSLFVASYLLDRAGYDGPLSLGLSSRSTSPTSPSHLYMSSPTAQNLRNPTYESFLWRVAEKRDFEEQVHRQVGIEWHRRYGVTKGATALDYKARMIDGVFVQLTPDDPTRYPVFIQPHEWDLPKEELVITYVKRITAWQAELSLRTRHCTYYKTLGLPDPIIEPLVTRTEGWEAIWTATSLRHALRRLNDNVLPRLAAQEAWVCMYRQALAENDAVRVPHRHTLDPWRTEPLYYLQRDRDRRILEVLYIDTEPAIREGLKMYHRMKDHVWEEVINRPVLRKAYLTMPLHSHEKPYWKSLVKERDSAPDQNLYLRDPDGDDREYSSESDTDSESASTEANRGHSGESGAEEIGNNPDALKGPLESPVTEIPPSVEPGLDEALQIAAESTSAPGALPFPFHMSSPPRRKFFPLPSVGPSSDPPAPVLGSSGSPSPPSLAFVTPDQGRTPSNDFYRCVVPPTPDSDEEMLPADCPTDRPDSNDDEPLAIRSSDVEFTPFSFVVNVPFGCRKHVGVPHFHVIEATFPLVGPPSYRTSAHTSDHKGRVPLAPTSSDGLPSGTANEFPFIEVESDDASNSSENTALGLTRSDTWPLSLHPLSLDPRDKVGWKRTVQALMADVDPKPTTTED